MNRLEEGVLATLLAFMTLLTFVQVVLILTPIVFPIAEDTVKASFPWLIVLLAVLMLITFVPWISLVVPELLLE